MLLNKLFGLCIALTSWNIYANLTLTEGKKEEKKREREENNVATFVLGCFSSQYFMGVYFNSLDFYFKRRKGHYWFSPLCFQLCYHSFQLISHFLMLIVLSFSTVSWSVGLGDIFNGIWQLMGLFPLKERFDMWDEYLDPQFAILMTIIIQTPTADIILFFPDTPVQVYKRNDLWMT